MSKQANKQLLRAVLEPRKPGAIQQIADACAAGADPNGSVPETSTAMGHVPGGRTLLTHAVHEEASRAVEKLLACGADPNLADDNGWTPWMASTLSDESKRARIQELLEQHGAEKSGERAAQLIRAVFSGDTELAASLLSAEDDLQVVSTFRVDLLRHQVLHQNASMLALLLERGMSPGPEHLTSAIRASYLEGVDLLLRHGVVPEEADDNETKLMTAAGMGEMAIVQRLVEAGADPNRHAHDDPAWTAAFYARAAGHTEVADWLYTRMDEAVLEQQKQREESRDPRFRALYERATAGEALSTDDIVAVLAQWGDQYGISVRAADGRSVSIDFQSLPEDMDDLYRDIVDLAPELSGDKAAILSELHKSKTLTLWWD